MAERKPGAVGATRAGGLFEALRYLQLGEAGSIVGGLSDNNSLRQALYVPTKLDEVVQNFFQQGDANDGAFLLVTGNAGDGKSALLGRAFQTSGGGRDRVRVHLDATDSDHPQELYNKTLADFLQPAIENLRAQSGPRSTLAINLGLGADFFERRKYKNQFPELWEFFAKQRKSEHLEAPKIVGVNLARRQTFETTPGRLGSGLLASIVEKFNPENPDSPFREAFETERANCPAGPRCILQYNFSQLASADVRQRITRQLASESLIHGIQLSPRLILHRLSSTVLPPELRFRVTDATAPCPVAAWQEAEGKPLAKWLVWNLVFRESIKGDPQAAGFLDPAARASRDVDNLVLNWNARPNELAAALTGTDFVKFEKPVDRFRTALRRGYLRRAVQIKTAAEWSTMETFLGALALLRSDDRTDAARKATSTLVDTVRSALRVWAGSGKGTDLIAFVDGNKSRNFTFLSPWDMPKLDLDKSVEVSREEARTGTLWLVMKGGGQTHGIKIPVTFGVYLLLQRVSRGYNPSTVDLERSEGVQMISARLSEFTHKKRTVRVSSNSSPQDLVLELDELESLVCTWKAE